MKQFLLILYKIVEELKISFKSSKSLISVKQRAGNRYMHIFALTFALSIFGVINILKFIELDSLSKRKRNLK